MDNNDKIKEFLVFQIKRKTTDLTKTFFNIMEDLIDEGYIISEEKYIKIRKRCLDKMNDGIRELETTIEKLDISLK